MIHIIIFNSPIYIVDEFRVEKQMITNIKYNAVNTI